MFGGMPAYQISVVYKSNLIQYVDKVLMLGLPDTAGYVFLYFIGFYFLLITLGVERWVAVFGALGFGFSSFFFVIIEAGHTSQAHAVGYMAPVMAGIIMTYRKKILAGAALTALALALELYANHVQITYYLFLMVVVFLVAEIIRTAKTKTWKSFIRASAALGAAALLAMLCNITNLWATYEYGKYSTRGPSELTMTDSKNRTTGLDKDYATEWSYGIDETLSLLIPDAKGGFSGVMGNYHKDELQKVDPQFRQQVASMDQYWGDQLFLLGPDYAGAIIVLLFFLGMVLINGGFRWWIVAAALLSMMLAWGRNFMTLTDFFLDHVPGYNKFRSVSMAMVVAEFCIPLLAALALDKVFKNPNVLDEMKKKVRWVAVGVIGFVLLVTLAPGITGLQKENEYEKISQAIKQNQPEVSDKQISDYLDQLMPHVEEARTAIFRADAMRTLFFMIVAALLIWCYFRFKFDKKYFAVGMIVLLLFDMWTVDKRYLNNDKFISKARYDVPFQMTQSDQIIKQLDPKSTARVLNLTVDVFQDASTSYFHHSIGGYHGAKMKRYKELIDYHLSPAVRFISQQISKHDSTLTTKLQVMPVLNMLNAKYFIVGDDGGVLLNPKALGNAWFVNEYKLVANADSEITALGNFNPAETAIVDKRFSDQLNGFTPHTDSTQTITLTSYEPNYLVYQSKATSEQLAVFSEIYYDKGWNAYVDGKLTPHFRCNYVLRAMRVPAGEHKIEFKFEPSVFNSGEKISLAASALLLLMVAGVVYSEWKNSKAVS